MVTQAAEPSACASTSARGGTSRLTPTTRRRRPAAFRRPKPRPLARATAEPALLPASGDQTDPRHRQRRGGLQKASKFSSHTYLLWWQLRRRPEVDRGRRLTLAISIMPIRGPVITDGGRGIGCSRHVRFGGSAAKPATQNLRPSPENPQLRSLVRQLSDVRLVLRQPLPGQRVQPAKGRTIADRRDAHRALARCCAQFN